jgi:hypothetical protein
MSRLVPVRVPSSAPASPECFILAKKWLRQCLESHEACAQRHLGTRLLPTRVIDVRSGIGSDGQRLYLTNRQPGEWLTLSWCWGSTSPLKTILATLDSHIANIPSDDLPPLFMDAINITRRLGYQYLWVDSLCIIQDSKLDWQTEAANMGTIYKESVLNIVAEGVFEDTNSILDGTRAPRCPVAVTWSSKHDAIQAKSICELTLCS